MSLFRRRSIFVQISSAEPNPPRRGLTVLEAIGALAAVSAGLWVGAKYLGIDLQEAWNLAAGKAGLEQFEIAADVTETESEAKTSEPLDDATGPPPPQAIEKNLGGADAATDGKMENEIERLRKTLERLEGAKRTNFEPKVTHGGRVAVATSNDRTRNGASGQGSAGERTLAFWNQLNQIMLKEETLRTTPTGGLTNSNAGGFLAARGKASRFASNAIRKLSTKNVDAVVTILANDIAGWYSRGAKLNDQASHLFHEANPASRRGPLGQSWSTAERQHRNELQLINRRGDIVRQQMINKYGLAFPDLR